MFNSLPCQILLTNHYSWELSRSDFNILLTSCSVLVSLPRKEMTFSEFHWVGLSRNTKVNSEQWWALADPCPILLSLLPLPFLEKCTQKQGVVVLFKIWRPCLHMDSLNMKVFLFHFNLCIKTIKHAHLIGVQRDASKPNCIVYYWNQFKCSLFSNVFLVYLFDENTQNPFLLKNPLKSTIHNVYLKSS